MTNICRFKAITVAFLVGLLGLCCKIGPAYGISRDTLHSRINGARRLDDMAGCFVSDADLEAAQSTLSSNIETEIGNCETSPCLIDCRNVQGFDSVVEACVAAGGVVHEFSFDITCETDTVEMDYFLECMVSQDTSSACDPAAYADASSGATEDGCSVTLAHTGTSSSSGNTGGGSDTGGGDYTGGTDIGSDDSVSGGGGSTGGSNDMDGCFVVDTDLEAAQSTLSSSVETEIGNCVNSPCPIDYRNLQGFDSVVAACEAAGGVVHEFSFDITCETDTVEMDYYLECMVSQDANSACDPAVYADISSGVTDDGCSVTLAHTGTSSGGGGDPSGNTGGEIDGGGSTGGTDVETDDSASGGEDFSEGTDEGSGGGTTGTDEEGGGSTTGGTNGGTGGGFPGGGFGGNNGNSGASGNASAAPSSVSVLTGQKILLLVSFVALFCGI
jgi:hypothetical protein